ncbi:DUF349 domain-containing protein [Rarobacter incanus]|uniref:Uncharacterized protein DUF349 n=1 Tax=Rarobacter incanus TaxID=153494 RepID=A0A542SNR3_9MICO|nr:DUF349 domain-containing protein [Rarobacter incanus]TQK75897.1 uncharacterized protein DUF349 [Rarobacter incanus]
MSESPETAANTEVTADVSAANPAPAPEPVGDAGNSASQPTAAPKPAIPTPRPIPKPTSFKPSPRPSAAPAAPAPAPTTDDSELVAKASEFGSVAADGTVFVRDGDSERVVGQVTDATATNPLDLYIRRYLDLRTKVLLFETRLHAGSISANDAHSTLASLHEELASPNAVGDLQALRTKVEDLRSVAKEQAAKAEAERQAAREAAIAKRTKIVEEAEALAAQDSANVQWKSASDTMHGLLEQWKRAQKEGPRVDRPTEDALWKRFSHARTTFDRERRHFFAALEEQHSAAKAAKEKLIAEAEKLSTSIAWGETAAAYRELMTEWKRVGHAGRRDDDALWSRFRAAQDKFFTARDAANKEIDAEYAANLVTKEALLAEAEALVPVKDLGFAKSRLRDVQDRWEAAGKVPREAIQRVESRLRAVEQAIRSHEEDQWKKSNPEVKARATGLSAQLHDAIARLEVDLAQAQEAGDDKAVREIEEGLNARRAWLAQIEKAATE